MKDTNISNLYDNKYELIKEKMIIPYRYLIIKKEIFENFKGNKKILDIGCGEGQLLMMLKDSQNQLYGIDSSKIAVNICNKKGLEVYQKNIDNEIKFDIPMDIIISTDTIEHILDHYHFFYYVNKSLKKDGILIITTPNSNRIDYMFKYLRGYTPTSLQNPLHVRFFSPTSIIEIAESQGFKLIKNLSTSILPNNPSLSKVVMKRKRLTSLFTKNIIMEFKKVNKPKYENINELMNLLRKRWYED